jgi:hypothetical protein
MFPGPTWALEIFTTIWRSVKFLYLERAKSRDQFSYIGGYTCIVYLGHPKSQVRGRISPPKLFSHDSNFWGDFLTNFQNSNLKGSKFWYFDPMNRAIFRKILNMEFWMLHLRHFSLGDQNDVWIILKGKQCSLCLYAQFAIFWSRSPIPDARSQFWA